MQETEARNSALLVPVPAPGSTGRAKAKSSPPLWRPVGRRLGTATLVQAGRNVVLITIGIDAIFVLQLFVSHLLPHVLSHQGSAVSLMLLTLYALPEAMYIVLPMALLIGIYLVFLRQRESRMYEVIAGAGFGAAPVLWLALITGLAGALVSLAISGFVEPHARYLGNREMEIAAYHGLNQGDMPTGTVSRLGESVAFIASGRIGGFAEQAFYLKDLGDGRYDLIMAARTQWVSDAETRKNSLVLHDGSVIKFGVSDGDGALALRPQSIFTFNNIVVSLPEVDDPVFGNPDGNLENRTSLQLLIGTGDDARRTGILNERFLRALLCLVAPLAAAVAVSFTGVRTQFVALPLTVLGILLPSIFGQEIARTTASFGLVASSGAMVLATVLIGLALAIVLVRFDIGRTHPRGVSL